LPVVRTGGEVGMIEIDIQMPEKCGLCPCFHSENQMYCQAVKADKNKKIVAPYGATRPEWCPLKEQEPAWISVKDKLPKSICNKVIVYLEHEDYVGYIGLGHYEKFRGEELWYDLENNSPFSKRGYTVTHWMPLPEPPKEGR